MFLFSLKSALRKLFAGASQTPIRGRAKSPAFQLESLEDRTVPTTFTTNPSSSITQSGAYQFNAGTYNLTQPVVIAGNNVTVNFQTGTYPQFIITGNNDTLQALSGQTPVIGATTLTPENLKTSTGATVSVGGAEVDVYGGQHANINGLTVNGVNATDGTLWFGIRVIDGGSANIDNDTVENILHPSTFSSGIGIDAGMAQIINNDGTTTTFNQSGAANGSGSANIIGDKVSAYLGAGVLVDGSAASAVVENCTIAGSGPTGGATQFGVQVSDDSSARVQSNTISNNTTLGASFANGYNSAGIWFVNDVSKHSVAAFNTLTGNDVGVLIQGTNEKICNALTVVNNTVTGSYGYAAIYVNQSSKVEVACNEVSNNQTYNGIALTTSSNVTVYSNDVGCNADPQSGYTTDGIYDYQGNGNQILANNSFSNSGNGVNLNYTKNDNIYNNFTWSNAVNGINDYYGTGNTIWLGSSSSNVDGIGLQDSTKDLILGNVLAFNSSYGIQLQYGSTASIDFNLIVVSNGAGSINADSTSSFTGVGNITVTAPTQDGAFGCNGSSNTFNMAACDADTLCSGI